MKQQNNSSNQKNPNKGTSGTNKQYDQVQGNRGKQMNRNNPSGKSATQNSKDKR